MSKLDINKIDKLEKLLKEQYGEECIKNPKSNWDEKKEKEYLEELKEIYGKELNKAKNLDLLEIHGVLISSKLLNKEQNRNCNFCKKLSFHKNDNLYLTKYKSCFNCYVQYIEGREEKFKNGDK